MSRHRRRLPAVLFLLACDRSPGPPSDRPSAAPPSLRSESTDAGPAAGGLDSVSQLGERIYLRGEFDSARTVWIGLLELSRALPDSVTEARALTWLGLTAWRKGDYGEARRYGEEALVLKRRLGLVAELSKSYNALGLLAWNEGRLGDGITLLDQALASARAAGDLKGVAAASGNLALVQTELGDFAEARRGFDSMRVAGRRLGDARIEGNALTNLGMLDVRVGDPASAVPRLQAARKLYHSIQYPTGEQSALGQLGTAYSALGEPRLALAAVDSALALSRAQGLRQEEASNLEALAELYREAGNYRQALSLYGNARTINAELGLTVEAGADLRSEAEIQSSLGAVDRGWSLAGKALLVHREAGARFEELGDLLLLADLAARSDSTAASERYLVRARALAARMPSRRTRAEVALVAAAIADRQLDPGRTLQALRSAQDDLWAGGYGMEHEAFRLEARALARLGRLDSAAAAGRRAVAAVERVRGGFGSTLLRTSYLADKQAAYVDLVGVLHRLGRTEEALEVADAARGRAFLESLAAARSHTGRRDILEETLVESEALLRQVNTLVEQIREMEEDPAANVEFLRSRLEAARGAYEALAVRTAELGSRGSAAAGTGKFSAAMLGQRLRPDEALVEFFLTEDSLFVFVARSRRLAVLVTPISPMWLTMRVRLARDLMGRSSLDPSASIGALEALHDVLLGPARGAGLLEGVRRLVFVPHRILNYVPFAALRDPATGRYLAQDYAVFLLPSAGTLTGLRGDSARTTRVAAWSASVFAPLTDRLPATRSEANAASLGFGRAAAFLGKRATVRAVRFALGSGHVVHLATHAELNPRNPLFSGIELAPSADASDSDRHLEVHEILGLRITSPLVFLSGCETAVGASVATDFVPGEDYATLARAFLHAGARNVIATLWRVEDQGAAEFATRFYRYFPASPPPEALALAQRDMLSDARYRAPYYWAGYLVSGEGEAAPRAQDWSGLSVR